MFVRRPFVRYYPVLTIRAGTGKYCIPVEREAVPVGIGAFVKGAWHGQRLHCRQPQPGKVLTDQYQQGRYTGVGFQVSLDIFATLVQEFVESRRERTLKC